MKKFLIASVVVLILSACNAFDFIDNPKDDDQLISAARACFDQGDYECALEYYGQLSNNNVDTKNSEEAVVILDQEGIGIGLFAQALKDGANGGEIITRLADLVSGLSLSSAKRVAVYGAYAKVSLINDAALRGLVRFASSLALAALMFAENNGGDGALQKEDIVSDPTTCTTGNCLVSAACNGTIAAGAATVDLDTGSSVVSGTVTLDMIHATFREIQTAMSVNELGATGKFSSGASTFSDTLINNFNPQVSASCYRQALFSNGIGA